MGDLQSVSGFFWTRPRDGHFLLRQCQVAKNRKANAKRWRETGTGGRRKQNNQGFIPRQQLHCDMEGIMPWKGVIIFHFGGRVALFYRPYRPILCVWYARRAAPVGLGDSFLSGVRKPPPVCCRLDPCLRSLPDRAGDGSPGILPCSR